VSIGGSSVAINPLAGTLQSRWRMAMRLGEGQIWPVRASHGVDASGCTSWGKKRRTTAPMTVGFRRSVRTDQTRMWLTKACALKL